MDELAARTGRRYGLVDYHGAPDAERVIVVMGSASGAVEETVDTLIAAGEKVGMLRIRLFQPFPAEQIVAALPTTVRAIAVLDRTKEPGAVGEPLYLEIVAALAEAMDSDDAAVRGRAAGHRRALRAVVQGDDALDDQADLRRAGGRTAQAPLHGRHLRRRDPPEPADRRHVPPRSAPPARSRPCSSGSARTARSAPTRPRSRSSARAPTCSPRATSSTTPRSRARSPSRTCASGPSRSARPT